MTVAPKLMPSILIPPTHPNKSARNADGIGEEAGHSASNTFFCLATKRSLPKWCLVRKCDPDVCQK